MAGIERERERSEERRGRRRRWTSMEGREGERR